MTKLGPPRGAAAALWRGVGLQCVSGGAGTSGKADNHQVTGLRDLVEEERSDTEAHLKAKFNVFDGRRTQIAKTARQDIQAGDVR